MGSLFRLDPFLYPWLEDVNQRRCTVGPLSWSLPVSWSLLPGHSVVRELLYLTLLGCTETSETLSRV